MPPLLVQLIFSRISQPPVPFFIRPIGKAIAKAVHANFTGPELEKHFAFIEAHLGAHPWFAGAQFSGADIQLSYPIAAAAEAGRASVGPHTRAWLARIQARPAYQQALEIGGPISL
jgi:glutathione S-transferase